MFGSAGNEIVDLLQSVSFSAWLHRYRNRASTTNPELALLCYRLLNNLSDIWQTVGADYSLVMGTVYI